MSTKDRRSADHFEAESPFLRGEIFGGEAQEEWEPRAIALAAESPFRTAIEEQPAEPSRRSADEERETMMPKEMDSWARNEPARVGHASDREAHKTIDESARREEPPISGHDGAERSIFGDTIAREWDDFGEAEESRNDPFRYDTTFDDSGPRFEGEVEINIKRAVAQNRLYAKKLHWDDQADEIKEFLKSDLGLSSISTLEDFARAVAAWQQSQGDKKPDGMLGPITWAKLQKAMKQANPPPVSPSQISPTSVSNASKKAGELAIGIYEAEYMTLMAWQSALHVFGVVMNSVSDEEGTEDFAGVLKKHIANEFLDFIAKASKVVSAAKKGIDQLVKESERAEKAREGAQLREFVVDFSLKILDQMTTLSATKDDYFATVRVNSEDGSASDNEAYRKRLVEYLDALDQRREYGFMTGKRLFALFAFAWIRNSKKVFLRGSPQESLVRVWVDKDDKIKKARINAPGGQKLAEQLLKDADGAGLTPYSWQVRRIILFFSENTATPNATARYTAQGGRDMGESDTSTSADDKPYEADRRYKRLISFWRTTRDVKGDE